MNMTVVLVLEIIPVSLDIETSGFDPLKNEILEVGFAFFVLEGKGIRITEEWTQVFRPKGEVPAKILGLTGITQKELDGAPSFSEHREFLQKKLGNAVIVGHNVVFDIKFLQAFGITFSGEVVDTLDLVQFILPTHHSYNLENLMHYFEVSHKDAHRALADSKACLVVLEKLLGVYAGFDDKLKKQMAELASAYNLPFAELLNVRLKPLIIKAGTEKIKPNSRSAFEMSFGKDTILSFPLGENIIQAILPNLKTGKEKKLLVVPKQQQVMEIWKSHGIPGVFDSEQLLDEKKLSVLSKRKDLTADEAKFLLKVLVWKHTNWQSECILDLNLSFFGGQFKALICGKKLEEIDAPVLCCDQTTLAKLVEEGMYKKRSVIIVGLSEYEQNISSNISQKVGWGYAVYLLRSFYNPELNSGALQLKDEVIEALAATDLFFGLAHALLKTDGVNFQYYKVTEQAVYSNEYQKIKQAAEHYAEKMRKTNEKLKSESLEKLVKNLLEFFEEKENTVKWIELAEGRCVFSSSPLEIKDLVKASLSNFKQVCFADSLGSHRLMTYFSGRLGLESFTPSEIKRVSAEKKTKKISLSQGDLFSKALKGIQTAFASGKRSVRCFCLPQSMAAQDMVGLLTKENLPAAVLFGGSLQVKDFYDAHYARLQEYAHLHTQSTSGGSNKIFNNFAIHNDSILIATDKFVLKYLSQPASLATVEQLRVKTLILSHLPFEQFTHPYQEALSQKYGNPFEEFSLPRAVYNFHKVLQFFNTDQLETVYICDPKLSKNYSTAFIEYLAGLPGIEMVK